MTMEIRRDDEIADNFEVGTLLLEIDVTKTKY